ncbi:hypothetical protein NOU10_03355 [Ligilactobacillus sp. MP3]|nr:hypothetical protein [Ligilactobacillus sp. MP3]MCQ4116426.1 hypothetical protein [Ligilactobacillus sp. MP3]
MKKSKQHLVSALTISATIATVGLTKHEQISADSTVSVPTESTTQTQSIENVQSKVDNAKQNVKDAQQNVKIAENNLNASNQATNLAQVNMNVAKENVVTKQQNVERTQKEINATNDSIQEVNQDIDAKNADINLDEALLERINDEKKDQLSIKDDTTKYYQDAKEQYENNLKHYNDVVSAKETLQPKLKELNVKISENQKALQEVSDKIKNAFGDYNEYGEPSIFRPDFSTNNPTDEIGIMNEEYANAKKLIDTVSESYKKVDDYFNESMGLYNDLTSLNDKLDEVQTTVNKLYDYEYDLTNTKANIDNEKDILKKLETERKNIVENKIILPENYEQVRWNEYERTLVNNKIDELNHFKDSYIDEQRIIYDGLSEDEYRDLTIYTIDLLNQARKQVGKEKLDVTEEAVELTKLYAENYRNKNDEVIALGDTLKNENIIYYPSRIYNGSYIGSGTLNDLKKAIYNSVLDIVKSSADSLEFILDIYPIDNVRASESIIFPAIGDKVNFVSIPKELVTTHLLGTDDYSNSSYKFIVVREKATLQKLVDNYNDLETKINNTKNLKEKYQDKFNTTETSLVKIEKQLDDLKLKIYGMNYSNSSGGMISSGNYFVDENNGLQARLKMAMGDCYGLLLAMNKNLSETSELINKVNSTTPQMDSSYKEKLDIANNGLATINAKLKKTEDLISRLQKKIDSSRKLVTILENKKSNYSNQITSLNKKLNDNKKELEAAKIVFNEYFAEFNKEKTKQKEAQKSYNTAQKELKEAQSNLGKAELQLAYVKRINEGHQKFENGHWRLYRNGNLQHGFQKIETQNKVVYYDHLGNMLYGQQNINGKWYNFDKVTGAMTIGEKYIPTQDKVVWYSDDGTMLYGWQNIDGKVHYFDKITGKMTTGQKNIDGHWYLFDSKGVMQQGFQNIGYQNKTVYYNEDGWMLYGWQNIDGKVYYFDKVTGKMTVGQKNIGGHWYLFDSKGAMQRGFQYIANQSKTVYYNKDGWMLYGWQNIDGKVYYFDKVTGKMTTGQKNIDGHWYLFNSKGVMQRGFQYISYQNKTVYYNKDGWMLYGHQLINGKKYYFNTITGAKE